jgi:hypothetical protein
VLRKPFVLLCLLSLAAIDVSSAQAVARQDIAGNAQSNRSGTWSAANTSGRTFMGTWTAVPDPKTGSVTGTWTLVDAQRKTLAGGGWSAARSPAGWTGAWRANVSGRNGEYSGTWNSGVDLKVDAGFDDLFEKAVQSIVSGAWQMAKDSGGWSIRAAKREAVP